jgi:NAD(P)-dependent dehydrogenase (short-subunit alcohol dehydrogenase family)
MGTCGGGPTGFPEGAQESAGEFEGRVGWVTGAARGQGLEEAGLFSDQGASVVVGDLLIEDGEYAAPALGTHSRV